MLHFDPPLDNYIYICNVCWLQKLSLLQSSYVLTTNNSVLEVRPQVKVKLIGFYIL